MNKLQAQAWATIGALLLVAASVLRVNLKVANATPDPERHMWLLVLAGAYVLATATTVLSQYRARHDTQNLGGVTAAFVMPSACLAFLLILVKG